MKKTVTKIIILIMVIPMLLIFTMGTAIDVSTVMLDHIPVTNVEIEGDETLFVDVYASDNSVTLNTIVSPVEASNKKVTYSIQEVTGEKLADVILDENGKVIPKSTGSVRVIATADGGRQESVLINFYSNLPTEVEQIKNNYTIEVGETINLVEGVDYSVSPVSSNITYTANNNNVKVDKYTGAVLGLFKGESIINAKIEGLKYDSSTKKFVEMIYEINYNVSVVGGDEDAIFSFAGGVSQTQEIMALNTKVIPFAYYGYADLGQLSYEIDSDDEAYI